MKFFRYFPQLSYVFEQANSSFGIDITNPTSHVVIVERLKQHVTAYYDYVISDGERPDSVATKVYGGPEYTWIILVLNNIQSLYDWPLTDAEFHDYIVDRYGSVANAQASKIYKTTEGFVVDSVSYNELPVERRGSISDEYTEEQTANENKRRIKLVPAEFVTPLVSELKRAFA